MLARIAASRTLRSESPPSVLAEHRWRQLVRLDASSP